MSTHCHLSTTITRAPPHTTSHLPSTTITPITLSDLFLFSPTQMSTHCHLSTIITRAPPHTPSRLPSTTINPITLSDLFLFSRTQMSTHHHLNTTITRAPPTYHIPPPFHYHHPQLPCLIYSYFPAMQVKCDGDRPPPTTFHPNYCLLSHDPAPSHMPNPRTPATASPSHSQDPPSQPSKTARDQSADLAQTCRFFWTRPHIPLRIESVHADLLVHVSLKHIQVSRGLILKRLQVLQNPHCIALTQVEVCLVLRIIPWPRRCCAFS